jgi:hypothetical protein
VTEWANGQPNWKRQLTLFVELLSGEIVADHDDEVRTLQVTDQ